MPETPRPKRPLTIPIRVFLIFLAGVGGVAIGMRMAQADQYSPLAPVVQIAGVLICVAALYDGTRSIRLSHLAKPIRPVWGNREVAITREGLLYIIILLTSFVAAFLGKSNLLLLVFSLLSATFLLNGVVTNLMLDKNRVRRRLPRNVMVGETLSVEVILSNNRRLLSSWLMILQDQIQNGREILQPRVLFRRIPPRSERSGWYQVRFAQRGIYQLGPLKLLTRFPLGFVERGTVVNEPGFIIVHPRVGLLTPTWRNESADAEDLMRHRRSRVGSHDDDFHRLREYRYGDNPKAIHWLSSARNNELMVREYHETRDRDLIVLLDVHGSASEQELDPQVERAVSFAASLVVDHCRRNRGAALALGVAGAERFYWRGSSGTNAIPHLLDELARAGQTSQTPLIALARELQELPWTKCHRILITTRSADEVSRLLHSDQDQAKADLRHPFRIISSDADSVARYLSFERVG